MEQYTSAKYPSRVRTGLMTVSTAVDERDIQETEIHPANCKKYLQEDFNLLNWEPQSQDENGNVIEWWGYDFNNKLVLIADFHYED